MGGTGDEKEEVSDNFPVLIGASPVEVIRGEWGGEDGSQIQRLEVCLAIRTRVTGRSQTASDLGGSHFR